MTIIDSNGNEINNSRIIPREFAIPDVLPLETEDEMLMYSPVIHFATPRTIENITDIKTKIPKNKFVRPEKNIDDVDFKNLLMEGDIEYLDLSDHYNINDFRGLGTQKSLIHLSLVGCLKIKNGDFLRGLKNLTALDITGTGIKNLDFVKELPNLEVLSMRYIEVRDLSPVGNLKNLRDLVVTGCYSIDNFSGLENLHELRAFDGHMLIKLRDISFMRSWKKIEEIYLDHCKPDTLEPLRELYTLKIFSMNRHVPKDKKINTSTRKAVKNLIEPLKDLTNLRHLDLRSTGVSDIRPLEKLTKMNFLNLGYGNFVDLSPLADMNDMRRLVVDEMAGVFDLSPLENMKKLTGIDLSGIRTPDLSVLKNFTKLEELDFSGNILVKDLSPIENLIELVVLFMNGCLMVDDLYYIRKLTKLIYFYCSGCPRITSGWPIRGFKKVVFMDISSTSIPYSEIAEFKRLMKLALFNGNSREILYKNAITASKTRKKINAFRIKLKF